MVKMISDPNDDDNSDCGIGSKNKIIVTVLLSA